MGTLDIIINGLLAGLVYGLAALGLTLIFGMVREVNLAHGGMVAAGFFAATRVSPGAEPLQALPLVALALFVGGFIVQRLVIERVPETPQPLRLLLLAGLALVLVNGLLLLAGPAGLEIHRTAASAVPLPVGPFLLDRLRVRAALVALMVTALLFGFFNFSRTGKTLRACADSPFGARAAGLDLCTLQALAFGLGAAITGIAGCLMASFESRPVPATDALATGLALALIGGLGSVGGALRAGLLIGMADALAGTLLPPALHSLTGYGLLVLVLIWRPRGLSGAELP